MRAADGSNFWFEDIRIQYELIPSEATTVLSDSGAGEGFKQNWVRAFARSILRDEFGKFAAAEIADLVLARVTPLLDHAVRAEVAP